MNQAVLDSSLTNINGNIEYDSIPFNLVKGSINTFLSHKKLEVEFSGSFDQEGRDTFEVSDDLKKVYYDQMLTNVKYLKNYSRTLQSWKGIIVELFDEHFICELEDLTNGGTKEIAQIELSNVSPDDKELVEIGASFYWNIGIKMNNGQLTKESIIRFQRIISWDSEDFDEAADRAAELFQNLKIE